MTPHAHRFLSFLADVVRLRSLVLQYEHGIWHYYDVLMFAGHFVLVMLVFVASLLKEPPITASPPKAWYSSDLFNLVFFFLPLPFF